MKIHTAFLLGTYLIVISLGVSFVATEVSGEKLSSISLEERIALSEKVKQIFGFPFDREGNSVANQNFHPVQEKLMEFCKTGVLEETKRQAVLSKILKNALERGRFPIEGKSDFNALSTQNPNIDVIELTAALIAAGRYKDIDDIVPFLEFSQIFYGNINLAFGHPLFILNFAALESQPNQPLPPEKRLTYWPAANALLKNQDVSVPILTTAVNRRDLRKDLRLRAASFLNTINPVLIDEDLLKVNPDIKDELSCIKDRGIKWRHSIYQLCRNETEKERQRKEILRLKLGLPEDADIKEVQKNIDQDLWGQY